MEQRFFGEIVEYPVGSVFASRKELSASKVHRPNQAGISGSKGEGADSVVLSGGYEDIDNGDEIIYTGQGGWDRDIKKQIADQTATKQNMALIVSHNNGLPVRVIRGSELDSNYSPKIGFRYDGLYLVDDYWTDQSNNHIIFKFRLVKVPEALKPPINSDVDEKEPYSQPKRIQVIAYRLVRDTKKALEVKKLYNYHCQVCNIQLGSSTGPYAEGAHIRPLGKPHDGPDEIGNILCLCPNHHVLFDLKAFSIQDNFDLIGIPGKLVVLPSHQIIQSCLEYRRLHY